MPVRKRSAAVAAAFAGAIVASRYRRDLDRDRARLRGVERSVLDTAFGRVEFARSGVGPPVLLVHGVLGGCDFGVGVGGANVPAGYRVISPSRFGYLGSPLPADPDSRAQADAFAVLLDHLEVERLPVVAFSAGSTSAVWLALRHPDRVSRLVLISPNAPHPEPLSKPPRVLAPIIFSQPVFWALCLLGPRPLQRLMGTPAGFVAEDRERAALQEIMEGLFPVGPRAPGTIFDSYVGNLEIAFCRFESITVPTLVIHAQDDTLSPYPDSYAMAQRIPGAQFVTVQRGGHALTHLDTGARRALERFLSAPPTNPRPQAPPQEH
jgi:pimeloyl-ACP methyl ester carboxylesterase